MTPNFLFLITSRQTHDCSVDADLLYPLLQSARASWHNECFNFHKKGTTPSSVKRKPDWTDRLPLLLVCAHILGKEEAVSNSDLIWINVLIFHTLWGASAPLATVALQEQLVIWPVNQSHTHPIKESSPNWFPPSTIAWDSEVRGSFFCGVLNERGTDADNDQI